MIESGALQIIGHRGAAGLLPENTLPSFRRAADLGCDAIETDLRRHGEHIYLLHDELLDRTTTGRGAPAEHAFEALRQLDAGDGAPIPLLDELLALLDEYPALDLHLELKETGVAELLAPRLRRLPTDSQGRLILSSFHPEALPLPLCERWPRAHASVVIDEPLLTAILARQYQAVHLADACVTASWVRRCQDAGLLVRVFTVNDSERAVELADWGVDGIFTDRPDRLLARRSER